MKFGAMVGMVIHTVRITMQVINMSCPRSPMIMVLFIVAALVCVH